MNRETQPGPGEDLGRYTVEATLGEGGMAVVYRVRHRDLGSLHALKMLRRTDWVLRQRLLQEGRLQANLRHPNIVAVTDVLDLDGAPALVMEFVEGPTLHDLVRSRPLEWEEVDHLAKGILRGVAAAHRNGLIHRDLKPANILIADQDGELVPKIADFGLAKALVDAVDGPEKTRTGIAMGTPAYMAPEQIRDAKHVDHRADLWSLGAILYELMTSTRAFPQKDTVEIFNAVCQARFLDVTELRPDAPARMVRAVSAAMRIDPDDRVESCDTLLDLWLDRARPGPAATPRAEGTSAVGPSAAGTPRPNSAATMTPETFTDAPTGNTFESIEPTPRPTSTLRRWAAVGVGLAALVAAVPLYSSMRSGTVVDPAGTPDEAVALVEPPPVTAAPPTPVATPTTPKPPPAAASPPKPAPATTKAPAAPRPVNAAATPAPEPATAAEPAATAPPSTDVLFSINTFPLGAKVTLFGKVLCTTPCKVPIPPGSHIAELELPDGRKSMQVITVSPTVTSFGYRF